MLWTGLSLTLLFSQGIALALSPLRGVWIDVKSIPQDRQKIIELVDQLHKARFNALFVESFYNGKTIYPSPFLSSLGISSQMEVFSPTQIDPLKIIIEAAHHRGMEVHAWLHFFYIHRNEKGEILSRFPHWAVVSKEGKPGYQSGANFLYFLCPLEKEVETFFQGLLQELAERYDLDGIQFDYFRFPEPTLADTCYAEKHRHEFYSQYGIDPITIDPLRDGDLSKAWNSFRSEGLTEFARNITRTLKERYPRLRLSCSVKPLGFPLGRYPGSLQDWPKWAQEGLFDFLIPMTYSSRPEEFEGMLLWVSTFLAETSTPFLGGIWTVNLSPNTILEEIERAQKYPLQGVVLFAYPYLTPELLEALTRLEPSSPPTRKIPPLSFYWENARTVHAQQVSGPITIDGKLEEPSWQEIPFQNHFVGLCGQENTKKTEIALQYDDQTLYVGFRLENFPSTILRFLERDTPVFYENSVELYLDPSGNEGLWYQFACNEGGGIYDASSLAGSVWNGNWTVKFSRQGDILIGEMAIPLADLRTKEPKEGEVWGINFYRNEPQENRFEAFSPVPGVYPAATFLGKLQFE
ncbi:MAG: family 10 glycosylhydrolase [Candidatus Caldatribacteriaceae bacterium]